MTLALGANFEQVPLMRGPITDLANVLLTSDRDALTKLLNDFQAESHHQIAVLTVPTLNGESIESLSLRVANSWGVGLKHWNDGILVTIALQERGIRIELGKGMERYISNATARQIIDYDMRSPFEHGDIAGGLRKGLLELMERARQYKIINPQLSPAAAEQSRGGSALVGYQRSRWVTCT